MGYFAKGIAMCGIWIGICVATALIFYPVSMPRSIDVVLSLSGYATLVAWILLGYR